MARFTIDNDGCTIRIGYRTPGIKSMSVVEKIELAHELGMEVVEPNIGAREFPTLEEAKQMREAGDRLGVAMPSLSGPMHLCNPEVIETQLENLGGHGIELCKTLGANYVFGRVMNPPEGIPQQESWDLMVVNTRRVADILGAADIKFAIEADPPCFIHTLERFRKCLEEINHPNCYPNYDPTNIYVVGSDPMEVFDIFGTRIVSAHIKDGVYQTNRKEETPVGEGEVDYPTIFREILKRKYSMNMFIEHCKEADQVRAAAAHVDKVLTEVLPEFGIVRS